MINTTFTGRRCRATRQITDQHGLTARFTEGTIRYDLDNIGRHLFLVEWDNGVVNYVFPFEIEMIDQGEDRAPEMDETGFDSPPVAMGGEITWN